MHIVGRKVAGRLAVELGPVLCVGVGVGVESGLEVSDPSGSVREGGGLKREAPAVERWLMSTTGDNAPSHKLSIGDEERGLAVDTQQAQAGASPGAQAHAASPTWHIPRGSS